MSSEKLRKEAQKLLSSQLARITGILADAAKHRDELVKKKMGASRDGSESSGVQSPGPTIRSDKSTRGSLSSKRDEPTTANAREDVVQADWTSSPTNTSVGEDPRQVLVDMERERETMLAQVDRDSSSLTGTASHNDPLRLLAELDRHSQSIMTSLHSSDMLIDDIDSLRVEFESLRAGPRNNGGSASGISQRDGPDQRLDAFVTPTEQNGQCQPVPGAALGCPTRVGRARDALKSPKALDKELAPYVAALELELKGCDWGKVAGWTKYLFSDGDEGYKAQQEKTAFIQNCEEEIAELVESTRKQMSFDHLNKKHLKDARRIIVTNIAADAGVYELAVVFDDFEIRDITILNDRHPDNGTRAAYIDFYDSQSAYAASRLTDYVFGLKLRIRLASELV